MSRVPPRISYFASLTQFCQGSQPGSNHSSGSSFSATDFMDFSSRGKNCQIHPAAGWVNLDFIVNRSITKLPFRGAYFRASKIQLFKVDSLLLPIYDMIMQKTELKIKPAGFPDISRVLGLSYTLKSKIFMNNKKFDQSKDAAILSNILLKNWPIYNVRNHASFASIYFSQDSLYLALGEIDKGLRICKLKGLSVEELQLLELKMDFFEKSKTTLR